MENNFSLNEAVYDEQGKRMLHLVTKEDLLYLFSCHLLEGKNTERPQISELLLGLFPEILFRKKLLV